MKMMMEFAMQVIVFCVSLGSAVTQLCSLQTDCASLASIVRVDAFSTRTAGETFRCTQEPLSWGFRRYSTFEHIVARPCTAIQTNENTSYVASGRALTITNIDGRAEGLYTCATNANVEPCGNQATIAGCLVVIGRGVFTSCNNSISSDSVCTRELITVDLNDNAMLDTSVTFMFGGVCQNETVRTLTLLKEGMDGNVFFCSNLAGLAGIPCKSNDKVMVIESDPSCGLTCKYDITLVLLNFNESDVGRYTAEIMLQNIFIERRPISREFDLQLSNADSSSGNPPLAGTATTLVTDDGTAAISMRTTVGISVGVVVFVLLVIAVAGSVVVICIYRYKTSGGGKSSYNAKAMAAMTPTGSHSLIDHQVTTNPTPVENEDFNDHPLDGRNTDSLESLPTETLPAEFTQKNIALNSNTVTI